ncbi:unnamed protein product [Porites evermanni]|uniref:Uncharacterized protein n=1 Tax=Porites evermanni TaxID=104178 RepID=A0ABN8M119_9CNID|nr:unnamed protein product [Porites evermanni]
MSAIISAVLKGTIGLILKKGRDVAAEKLKDGDVTDQKLRGLIVSELNDIKGKLDALSKKDLKAAVDFFGTGLKNLNGAVVAMRGANVSVEAGEVSETNEEEDFDELALPSDTDPGKTIAVAAGIRNMQLTELDETTKSLLSKAKEKFRLAVEYTTHACNNEALSTFDRITAIRYRVMAAMLESAAETARTTGDLKSALMSALPECEHCLEILNSLPAVQNSFKVELSKGLLNIRGQFGKDERMQIISIVCQVNRTIYDAMRTVGKDVHVLVWPYVDIGEDQVDPLRDVRVLQMLEKSEKVDMEHNCIKTGWSFDVKLGRDGKILRTNTRGQFLIANMRGTTVHVYDKNGMFQFSFNPQTDDTKIKIRIYDLVTEDVSEKIYLLIGLYNGKQWEREVQVLNKTADLQYKFPVRGGWRLIVSGSKLVILGAWEAHVYNQNGEFDRSFEFFKIGGDKELADCTATYDGRILIRHDKGNFSDYFCVHVFTMEGQEIAKFRSGVGLNLNYMYFSPRSAGEHVVIAGYNKEDGIITVELYAVDGKLV